MKTAKRALALLLTLLMLTGGMVLPVGAKEFDLQTAIDQAASGATVTLPGDVTASVVIDKDLTLDLGGYELTGEDGKCAILVKNADVTVRNGHVYSKFANVPSVTLAQTVSGHSSGAMRVCGGSLTVEGLRVAGSFARIPTTQDDRFPTGSAIEAVDGAEVTVIQSSLIGRYGVNNAVAGNAPSGTVTIEDGILAGFLCAVKDMSALVIPADTEDVNAADRLEGFLNSGITLEAREKALLKTVLADRLHIYTKTVADKPAVTIKACADSATVKAAADVSRVWANNTSTDCSYKYVPEALVYNGKSYPLTGGAVELPGVTAAEAKAADIQVKYRLQFVLQDDVKAIAADFDGVLAALLKKAVSGLNAAYAYALDKYTTYMDALHAVDDKMMVIEDPRLAEELNAMPKFALLKEKIFKFGGAVMATWGESWYSVGDKLPESYAQAYTGDQNYVLEVRGGKYIYGVLDRVALLKSELDAYMPLSGSDQSRWPEMVKWAYDNYEEVLSLLDDSRAAILDVKAALNDFGMEKLLQAVPQAQAQAAKLDTALGYIDTLKGACDVLLSSGAVQTVLQKLEANENEIIPYTQKFIGIFNNIDTYITMENFLLEDGAVGKAYGVFAVPKVTVKGNSEDTHAWGEWEYSDEENHERVCRFCGEIEVAAHNYVLNEDESYPADEFDEGLNVFYCDDCGDMIRETLVKLQHQHQYDAVYVNPTCVKNGYWSYYCPTCGDEYTQEVPDTALGHDYVLDAAQSMLPTCAAAGCEVRVCSRCGDRLEVTLPKTNDHTYDIVNVTRPTCFEDGYAVYTCSVCTTSYTVWRDDLKSTGHNWDEANAEIIEATCTTEGEVRYTCLNDPTHILDKTTYDRYYAQDPSTPKVIIPVLGHNWHKDEVIAPTCGEEGYTVYSCLRCGETEHKNIVPATGAHRFDSWSVAEPATCLAEGKESRTCLVCGETEYRTIPRTGHKLDQWYVVTPATCTEDGTERSTCLVCGDIFDRTISATGHLWDEASREWLTHPTCTKDGAYRETCLHDVSHTRTFIVSALGHDFTGRYVVITPATTSSEGLAWQYCSRCDAHIEIVLPKVVIPKDLEIRDSYSGLTGKDIHISVPYARRNFIVTTLTPVDTERKVTYVSSNTKLVNVDANGTVRFTRLNPFRRSARITVRDDYGNSATCDIQVKYEWYHYILWFLLLGWLWY